MNPKVLHPSTPQSPCWHQQAAARTHGEQITTTHAWMAQEKENSIHEGCKTSPSRQCFHETMAETLPESTWEASCLLFPG